MPHGVIQKNLAGEGVTIFFYCWFMLKRLPLGYTRAKTEDFKKNFILHLQPKMRCYTPGSTVPHITQIQPLLFCYTYFKIRFQTCLSAEVSHVPGQKIKQNSAIITDELARPFSSAPHFAQPGVIPSAVAHRSWALTKFDATQIRSFVGEPRQIFTCTQI